MPEVKPVLKILGLLLVGCGLGMVPGQLTGWTGALFITWAGFLIFIEVNH